MEIDMSVYLSAFLDEVDEQLQILDEEVLNLEQDAENLDTIQKIFRAAHTLKGSSAAMGMDQMKELTHKVENVFDSIRNHQLKVDTQIINLIFDSIDTIKLLKEAILNGTIDSVDVSTLIAKLEACKNTSTKVDEVAVKKEESNEVPSNSPLLSKVILDEYQRDMVEKAFELGMNVMAIYVCLNEDTMLKSVRVLLIENNLKDIGEIIATFPTTDVIEEEEKFEGNVVFILVTELDTQEVLMIVNSVSDIKSIDLNTITPANINSYCLAEKRERNVVEQKVSKVVNDNPKPEMKVKVQQSVRVDVDRLESLLNLVGELVISQTRLTDVRSRLAERYTNDSDMEGFQEVENQFGRIVSELQEGMMKTRMLPIEQLFNRFPRMVRDIAQKAEKEVNFVVEGKETELDRSLIEEISDPIIHLLRNSLDHGIESPEERESMGKPRQGNVLLKAAHEENHIVITISDDGKGIDTNIIKHSAIKKQQITEEEAERMTEKELMFLIFKSGVSTAAKITDISGRGVGMDIVRSHIEKLNGIIDIDTKLGEGTTFYIKLPLTLAIIRSLLIGLGDKQFAIPLANVQEIIRLGQDEVKTIQNQEVGVVRDRVLPLVRLHNRFNINPTDKAASNKKRLLVVVVGLADKRVGLVIDKTLGNQEIVIKPLGKYMGTPTYIAGATIMGDGTVALIMDVGAIVTEEGAKDAVKITKEKEAIHEENIITLTAFKLGNEEYGIEIDKVQDIITVPNISPIIYSPFSIIGMSNYRGKLISVMDLRKRLSLPGHPLSRKSRIIVVEINNELLGLLVDQVTQVIKINEDKMENPPNYESQVDQAYVQGIYHVEDRLMILLDIDQIIEIENLIQLKHYIM